MVRKVAAFFVLAIAPAFVQSAGMRPELDPGEGFVVVKTEGTGKELLFQRFQSKDSFTVTRRAKATMIPVKAGRYYLRSITSIYNHVVVQVNDEPREPSQTILIREGAVTYLGDWTIDDYIEDQALRYSVRLDFNSTTVRSVLKRHRVRALEVYVSKLGETPVKMSIPTDL